MFAPLLLKTVKCRPRKRWLCGRRFSTHATVSRQSVDGEYATGGAGGSGDSSKKKTRGQGRRNPSSSTGASTASPRYASRRQLRITLLSPQGQCSSTARASCWGVDGFASQSRKSVSSRRSRMTPFVTYTGVPFSHFCAHFSSLPPLTQSWRQCWASSNQNASKREVLEIGAFGLPGPKKSRRYYLHVSSLQQYQPRSSLDSSTACEGVGVTRAGSTPDSCAARALTKGARGCVL